MQNSTDTEVTKQRAVAKITQLDCGMPLVVTPMPHSESVAVGIWVHTGSRSENLPENGIAHMLEHMAFKGTEKRSAYDLAQQIESVGGHMNAYTSREVTAYYIRILPENLPLALDILADVLYNSRFPEEEMARERHVILQEIGQNQDTPEDVVYDYFQEQAFPAQPLGRNILGSQSTVSTIQRHHLFDFMQRFYRPEQMVLSVAGACEFEEVCTLAHRYLDSHHVKNTPQIPDLAKGQYQGGGTVQQRELEQIHLLLGLRGLDIYHPDYYGWHVFSTLLGGGMSSRLFQEIREKRGLVYSIYSFASAYRDTGLFGIYAGTSPEDIQELTTVLCQELVVAAQNFQAEELQRAKTQLKASLLMGRDSPMALCEQAAHHMLFHKRCIPIEETIAKIDAVDENVLQSVRQWMLSAQPTIAALGPVRNFPDARSIYQALAA